MKKQNKLLFYSIIISFFIFQSNISPCQSKNEAFFIQYLSNNFSEIHPLEGIYNVGIRISESALKCRSCNYPNINWENFDRIVIYNENGEIKIFSLYKNTTLGSVEVKSTPNNYGHDWFTFRLNYFSKNYMSSERWHNSNTVSHLNTSISTYIFSPHTLTEYKKLFDVFTNEYASQMTMRCSSDDPMCYYLDVVYTYTRIFPDQNFTPPPKISSGTGFFINESNTIVTNHHVVFNETKYGSVPCLDIKVKILDDPIEYPAEIIAYDKLNDLAVIKILENNKPLYPTKYLKINNSELDIGSEAYTLGYPFGELTGSNIKFTKGYISSISGLGDDPSSYTMDISINPGNSGGPILDQNHFVRGVANARLDDDAIGSKVENISYSIKSNVLSELCKSKNIKYYGTYLDKIFDALNNAYKESGDFTCSREVFVSGIESDKGYAAIIFGALEDAYGVNGSVAKGAFTLSKDDFFEKIYKVNNASTTGTKLSINEIKKAIVMIIAKSRY